MINNDETLLSCEVQTMAENLDKLLNDELNEILEMECIEPDFKFKLYPKKDLRNDPKSIYYKEGYEIDDISMEWIVYFWNDSLTNNHLSLQFDKDDINHLYNYLNIVMGNIDNQDERVVRMVNEGVLYE